MNKLLIVSCMAIFATSLFAMPMSPELEQQLKEEGRYNQVVQMLMEAKRKGIDVPNPNPIRREPGERLTLYAIAILVDFSDNVASTDTLHYDSLLSSIGIYPTESFRDYFLENSYNNVDVVMTIVGWLRMPQTYAYYVNGNYGFGSYPQNAQRMAEDAVWLADPLVDFSQFDNDGDNYVDALFIIHAGPGAEQTGNPNDIWSHAWSMVNDPYVDGVWANGYSTEPEDGRVGVFAHEAGHAVFGLPDLYDYDYDSRGAGNWTIMAFGSWNFGGRRPAHLDAYCKIQSGFVTPQEPTSNQTNVQFPAVEFSPVVYKLWTDGTAANEYFLVENRQKVGFDDYLPSAGMLIYHCDENVNGNDNQWYPGYTSFGHYEVAVEQADGQWHLEQDINAGDAGDPYPGNTTNRTYDVNSTPDSKDYSFNTTYVSVNNISDSGDTMTANLYVSSTGVEEDVTNYDAEIPEFGVSPSIARSGFNIFNAVSSGHKSVSLKIYDVTGRLIKSFDNLNAFSNQITWRADDNEGNRVSPGIYFVQLVAEQGNFSRLEKVILLK